ncbi:response regulator transcription factor [Azospirillum picis]|uniref:FixJ family two-component response regulator n=1 Tax=Azospirillum picis TaxID=488438 RepID=A0ABU0MNZ2_9PROT|nr:response regulator [Azospirillum picis]MBP2301167.1 FixJ family two-component response regulator [Azospirillum picis]MDQ0534871.1 FixJ family two-component response regulator [Azospirillum picis]
MDARSRDGTPRDTVTVVIIDDDEAIREALEGLLDSVGLQARSFASVQQYIDGCPPIDIGCMVLDVRLPERSGLDFQIELAKSRNSLPVIFISGHADVPMSVRAMKAGAFEFLTKPVHHQQLLDAIHAAVTAHRARRDHERGQLTHRARFEALTAREREIALMVVAGRRNKQIADDLGISEATVKLHRGQAMRKMAARSIVELVRIVDALMSPAA